MTAVTIREIHLVTVERTEPIEDLSMSPTSRIRATLESIYGTHHICDRSDLDAYCLRNGGTRAPLYNQVQQRVPNAWASLKNPKAGVRGTYETLLPGYKLY